MKKQLLVLAIIALFAIPQSGQAYNDYFGPSMKNKNPEAKRSGVWFGGVFSKRYKKSLNNQLSDSNRTKNSRRQYTSDYNWNVN